MNYQTILTRPVSRYVLALTVGLLGAIAAVPTLAQSIYSKPLQLAQADSLTGSWRLVNMGEIGSPAVVPQDSELTAEFAEKRISGSGGCNRFMGGYETQQAGTVSIGPLASTFMACEPPILDQESRYLKALQAAQRYELDDQGQLAIFYRTDQESGVLRFASQTTRSTPETSPQNPPQTTPENVRGLW